ncbi:MAG: NAD-binding protein [Gemmatimonadota bacterium]
MRRIWKHIQWPLMALLAVVALILGFVGFAGFFVTLLEPRSNWDIFYLTLQLFVLESGSVWGPVPWQLQVARLLAPAVAGYAAIGALAILFREQFEQFRVRFFRGHVVICALGRKGLLLAKSLRQRGDRVVIIEEDAENDLIETAREYRAVVFIGDARDPKVLRKARVNRANHLVVVSGDDGVNAEVAVQARRLVSDRRTTPLSCLVHVVDPDLCDLLRMKEVGKRQEGPFRLDFFNVFEGGARALLREHPVIGNAEEAEARGKHMVVVGFGKFGESLVLQAAREWRGEAAGQWGPLQVTVADRTADSRIEALLVRYPWVGQACHLRAVNAPFESKEFAEARFLFDSEGHVAVSSIYICLDDDSRGVSTALMLYRHVRDGRVPIVVRTVHGAGLASLLRQDQRGKGQYSGLYAFGLLDRMCNPELLFSGVNEILARAIHEEYVRSQERQGETIETNPAIVRWSELGDSFKESNRAQAAHIGVKLEAVGCNLAPLVDWGAEGFTFETDEVELLAEMEHDRWVEERTDAGWTDGDKDPVKKKSPHLVPWGQLGKEIRELDRVFIRGLPRFLAKAGFRIVRSFVFPRMNRRSKSSTIAQESHRRAPP